MITAHDEIIKVLSAFPPLSKDNRAVFARNTNYSASGVQSGTIWTYFRGLPCRYCLDIIDKDDTIVCVPVFRLQAITSLIDFWPKAGYQSCACTQPGESQPDSLVQMRRAICSQSHWVMDHFVLLTQPIGFDEADRSWPSFFKHKGETRFCLHPYEWLTW